MKLLPLDLIALALVVLGGIVALVIRPRGERAGPAQAMRPMEERRKLDRIDRIALILIIFGSLYALVWAALGPPPLPNVPYVAPLPEDDPTRKHQPRRGDTRPAEKK